MADTTFAINFLNVTFGEDDLGADSAIRATPTLQLFDIVEEGGSTVEEKFYLSGPRGFSGNYTDAVAVAQAGGGSQHFRWQHPFGKREGSIQVEYVDIMSSRKSQAAANQALEAEMERGYEAEGQNIADLLMGRAGLAGGLGTYSDDANGDGPVFSILFTDASDARKYQHGDQVVISTTDGASAGDIVGEIGFVVGRDVSEGWIQIAALDDTATAANPGSWVDGTDYYVFRLGEYADGSPSDIITPLEAFLPSAIVTTTLNGVDRSHDASLCGARLHSTEEKGSILQRSRKLITKMSARYGTDAKKKRKLVCVLNPEDHGTAEEELIAKLSRDVGVTTEEGYESFVTRTAMGQTTFVSDPSRNKGRAFILDVDRLKLYSPNGKLFESVDAGHGVVHLMPGRNTLEIRTIAKLATGIGAPFMHGTFSCTVA